MNKYKLKEYAIAAISIILTILATAMITNIITGLDTKGEIKRLEIKLEESNKTIEELENENNKLKSELDRVGNGEDIATWQNQAEELKNKLDDANKTIESLNEKINNLENSNNSLKEDVLGQYEVFVSLDDDSVSNLITAVYLLNGTSIKSNRSLSVAGVIGTLGDYNYIDTGIGYASGTEYVADTLYKASLRSDLQIMDYNSNNQGFIFIDDSNDLIIRNNTSNELVIKCGYSKGLLSVSIVKS